MERLMDVSKDGCTLGQVVAMENNVLINTVWYAKGSNCRHAEYLLDCGLNIWKTGIKEK
jgi:hypothetical protein